MSIFTSARRRFRPGLIVLGLTLAILAAGCAAGAPSLNQPRIRNKLDLRLQSALGGSAVGETLGEYIRVLVRLESDGTEEDLTLLNQIGTVSPFNGAITTMTVEPSRIIDLAVLERVTFIELQSPNAPKPDLPPPPPAAGGVS
jgi:hypothetical protein